MSLGGGGCCLRGKFRRGRSPGEAGQTKAMVTVRGLVGGLDVPPLRRTHVVSLVAGRTSARGNPSQKDKNATPI
jgi:hypothetical protein